MTKGLVLTVVGARPQFIKAASLSRAFRQQDNLKEILVHTGQHFSPDMSDVFFSELEIPPPKYDLGINGGFHGEMTGHMLEGLEHVFQTEKPDIVVVFGDTNSTIAGALAATKLLIPVAHVEAGLRSYNRSMPEEVNRVLTDHISSLLFCPTQVAVKNLSKEGISKGVFNVGDVMFDACLHVRGDKRTPNIYEKLGINKGEYAISTVHRAENTNKREALKKVIDWLKDKAKIREVVLPLHPRTREAAQKFGLDFEGLTICNPVSYTDMAHLLNGAVEVYTDSGSLQKEAYFYRKRCVTLRQETEWVETIACGWNRLWQGPDYVDQKNIDEYGDGRASMKIVHEISSFLTELKS